MASVAIFMMAEILLDLVITCDNCEFPDSCDGTAGAPWDRPVLGGGGGGGGGCMKPGRHDAVHEDSCSACGTEDNIALISHHGAGG